MSCPALYAFPYFYNFGDAVGKDLIQELAPVKFSKTSDTLLVTIGSVIHIMHKTSKRRQTQRYREFVLWGTGANPTSSTTIPKGNIVVKALRGPLTRQFLLDQGLNVPKDVPYGDPALLIPTLFDFERERAIHNICIIPHFNDVDYVRKYASSYNLIYPTEEWKTVWRKFHSVGL